MVHALLASKSSDEADDGCGLWATRRPSAGIPDRANRVGNGEHAVKGYAVRLDEATRDRARNRDDGRALVVYRRCERFVGRPTPHRFAVFGDDESRAPAVECRRGGDATREHVGVDDVGRRSAELLGDEPDVVRTDAPLDHFIAEDADVDTCVESLGHERPRGRTEQPYLVTARTKLPAQRDDMSLGSTDVHGVRDHRDNRHRISCTVRTVRYPTRSVRNPVIRSESREVCWMWSLLRGRAAVRRLDRCSSPNASRGAYRGRYATGSRAPRRRLRRVPWCHRGAEWL